MVANIGHGRARRRRGRARRPRRRRLRRPDLVDSAPGAAPRADSSRRWLPAGMGNVFFTSGGSESADSAMRLARADHVAAGRPERWKVVGRHPSYHGITLGAMAAGSHSARRAGYEPLLLDLPKVPWDDAGALVETIEREDPATIAAFLFEPITGAAGACLMASDEYWEAAEEVCRRHDILLIADEVMTGFGRTGRRWGHEHLPIRPDVVYGGKGLGGGYVPIGHGRRHRRRRRAAARPAVHVLHVHRQRRRLRRRRRRARRARGRAPRRASRRDGRRARRACSPTCSATTPRRRPARSRACSEASSSSPSGGRLTAAVGRRSASPATCGSTRPVPARSRTP